MEEVARHAVHKVLAKVGIDTPLIVGNPQGISADTLYPQVPQVCLPFRCASHY